MTGQLFWIGLDDTDSSAGMCTTWLGTRLIHELTGIGFRIEEARLIRLNPTIPYRTRGNAAVAIRACGDPEKAFDIACSLVTRFADLGCSKTHPGVVICDDKPPYEFYHKALTSICTIAEAEEILQKYARYWKGYKLGRGLIGATAAIASNLPDFTWEYLIYRNEEHWGSPRIVNEDSIFTADEVTRPHTWDSADPEEGKAVCIPHGHDPVLFGIRGDSPFAVTRAATCIRSEPYRTGQVWLTNQGTDAHLLPGRIGTLEEGCSYRVRGTVISLPSNGRGGHVSLTIGDGSNCLPCMAYEPTKGFRQAIRALIPGDRIIAVGSFVSGTLNLEKIYLFPYGVSSAKRAPFCPVCSKQMTSAGAGKGYKCRKCGEKRLYPEIIPLIRSISPGWYEVPPSARRHLARPLIRGPGYDPEGTSEERT